MAEHQREKLVIEVIGNKRRILALEVEPKELNTEILTTVLHSEETWKKEEETHRTTSDEEEGEEDEVDSEIRRFYNEGNDVETDETSNSYTDYAEDEGASDEEIIILSSDGEESESDTGGGGNDRE